METIKETTDKHSPKWLLTLKSTIRPFLTYIYTTLYMYMFIHNKDYNDTWVNNINHIMLAIIIFWFGERVLRNIGLNNEDIKVTTDHYSPKWVMKIKSTVRPFLTYLFTGLYIYVFLHKDKYSDVWVSNINNIILFIILFWFGERTLRNIDLSKIFNLKILNNKAKENIDN